MLKNKFETLCLKFSQDTKLIEKLWGEVTTAHLEPNRYYHTLTHLEQIYRELEVLEISPLLEFAIFYHDIVYDASSTNNEEASALYAMKHLNLLAVKQSLQDELSALILETKTHQTSKKEHTLFLDADISILGLEQNIYEHYTQNIRKEYAIYDDRSYVQGRKKVLKFFLAKKRIYESNYFYERYEQKAHNNLNWELKKLSE